MGSLHGSLVKISVKLLEDTGEPGHTFRRYHGTDRAQIRRIFILYIIHYECRICSSNLRYTIKRQMPDQGTAQNRSTKCHSKCS